MRLSVIIPAYNEEKRINNTLKEIDKYLSLQDYDSEIVVVSDGSTDRTVEVVQEAMKIIKNLKLIDNKQNRGKGFVTRQGMLEAKGEFRVFTDADNSTTIDHIEKFWPYLEEGYDVIIGSREIKGAILDPPQSWLRRRTGRLFRFLTNIFTGLWDIEDTQCGFKCFTKRAVEDIFPRCRIDRFSFDVEILVIAKLLGYKIKEVPIRWVNDPHSKVNFKNMAKMGFDLIKIRRNLIKKVYV